MPILDRPRERLLQYGVNALSNEELLSIVLKNGYKNNYKSHCVPNYAVKRATVDQLWVLCGLDKDSIVKDFIGE